MTSQSELYHANGATAGYDSLNQLAAISFGTLSDANSDGIPDTISSPSRSQSWTPDGQGNFTTVTTNGTGETRTYDKQNELTAVGSTSLTYDAAGNLKTDEQNRTFVYDAWNGLISVSVPNNPNSFQAVYTIDPLGRRITETSGGVTRDLYYSADWQVIEERVGGVAKAQFVWSPVYVDALIERDRDADGNTANGLEERLYVQHDANFNVTALVDTSGNVVERYVYDPYGKVTILSPDGLTVRTSSNYGWSYLHQGGRQDTATGLLNFRNRDYSTSLMRWTTNDPIGFAGGDTNTYRYVGNGPGNGLDPTGLKAGGGGKGRVPVDSISKALREEAEKAISSRDIKALQDLISKIESTNLEFLKLPLIKQAQDVLFYEKVKVVLTQLFAGAGLPFVAGRPGRGQRRGPPSKPAPGPETPRQKLGREREEYVARIVDGRTSGEKIIGSKASTDIDVIGSKGELIAVGGPQKSKDIKDLSKRIGVLIEEAKKRGGASVKYFFEEGTPKSAIEEAIRLLGKDNVFVFPKAVK